MPYKIAKHTPVGDDGKLDKSGARWSVVRGTEVVFTSARQSKAITFKEKMHAIEEVVEAVAGNESIGSMAIGALVRALEAVICEELADPVSEDKGTTSVPA